MIKNVITYLGESEIRFAGIVDKNGKLIAGGFKKGIIPYENDETKLQSFFEFVSISIYYEKNLMKVWVR